MGFSKLANKLSKAAGKRRHNGPAERRQLISLFELLTAVGEAIVIVEAVVEGEHGEVLSVHAIVWDAWRRILFFGPGSRDDRGMDGALVVQEADLLSESHVDAEHGVTLSEHVRVSFGIAGFRRAHVVMVAAKRAGETNHL